MFKPKQPNRKALPKRSLACQIVMAGMLVASANALADCNHFATGTKVTNDTLNNTSLPSDHARKHGVVYTDRGVTMGRDTTSWVWNDPLDHSQGGYYSRDTYNYRVWDVPNIIDTGSGGAYPGTQSGHGWGGTNTQTSHTINGTPIAAASTPVTGGECNLSHDYSPISHDGGNGRVEVASGEVTLKGGGKTIYSGIATKLEGRTTDTSLFRVVEAGQANTAANALDPNNLIWIRIPASFTQVGVADPALPGNNLQVRVYSTDEMWEEKPGVNGSHQITGLTDYVGDMQYINMKLGTATGGTLKVDLDDVTALENSSGSAQTTNTGNTVNLHAKQTTLLEASGGGTIEWQGNEKKWYFGRGDQVSYNPAGSTGSLGTFRGGNNYRGTFTYDGETYTVNNIDDLKAYNEQLKRKLAAGGFNRLAALRTESTIEERLHQAYRAALNQATQGATKNYNIYAISGGTAPTGMAGYNEATRNDGNKARDQQLVMKGSGAGTTVKLADNANLVVSHYQGESDKAGAILLEGGATGEIAESAKLSGFGSLVTLKGDGTTFTNKGKITAGSADTESSGNNLVDVEEARQHGYAVRVMNNAEFTNEENAVINVTSTRSTDDAKNAPGNRAGQQGVGTRVYAIRSEGGKKITNLGTINVGINDSRRLRDISAGIWVKGATGVAPTEVEHSGTINIGKAKDGVTNTSLVDPTYGIVAESAIKLKLTENSKIEIAENVENSIGILLNGGNNNSVSAIAGSTFLLEKGSEINVKGNRADSIVKENVGLQAINTADSIVEAKGTVNVEGKNAIGLDARGNAKIHIGDAADEEAGKINVDGGSIAAGRNIGVRAESVGPNPAEIELLGKSLVTLKGDGNIGVYGKGYANINVGPDSEVVMDATAPNAKNQIGYYLHGPNANLNFAPNDAREFNVATEGSTMFRMDEGAYGRVDGLKIKTDGKNSTAVMVSRKSRDATGALDGVRDSGFDLTGGEYNLTGEGSTFIKVDGGAKATIDSKSKVNLLNEGVRIGIVDGRGYHLNDTPDTRPGMPAADSVLDTFLTTETDLKGINTYITRTDGVLNYNGGYINLKGKDSNSFRMEDGGRLNVLDAATFNINGDFIQSHNKNSHQNNTIDAGRTNVANLNRNEVNAINVLNAQSGKVEVTTRGQSLLTGAAITDTTADSLVKLGEESVWNITDNSTLTNLINRGTINFVGTITDPKDKSQYHSLVINQDYVGVRGSTLSVNSSWYQPNDLYTNTVLIKGNATGRTRVMATNGIHGDVQAPQETDVGDGIERISENMMSKYDPKTPVITVLGSDNYDNEDQQTFVGEAQIVDSALVAQLVKKGKNYYWTLNHTLPAKDQPAPVVEEVPTPVAVPLYVKETAAYLQTQMVNRDMGYDLLGKLHDRVGEQQFDCACVAPQSWSRVGYTDSYNQGKERFGYDSRRGFVQFGQDLNVNVNEDRRVHTGIMAGYSWSNNRFYDKYSSANGLVLDDKETLGSRSQVASLGAYRTAYFANGSYLDLVVNGSWLHNKYRTNSTQRPSQNGYSVGGSIEFGRLFPVSETWYIQPQAQLRGQYLNLADIKDASRKTQSKDNTSLQGRVGARLTNGTFYVSTNLVHDIIAPKARVQMGTTGLEERYNPTTADIGFGGDIALDSARKWQVYGDVRYSRALGKTNPIFTKKAPAESYGGRVGIRYSW